MPRFSYTATKDNKKVEGSIEAANKEALISTLRKQGLIPVVIKVEKDKKLRFRLGGKVKSKELVVFTRQLSTMISAGVPLNRSLHTLEDQAKSPQFKKVVAAVAHDVEGGTSLAESFAKHPEAFSDVYVNMVRAGETGGILDEILKRLSLQLERDSMIRKKIRGAMFYPVVILSVTVVAFFGIMIFIIPKLSVIIKDLGGENAKLPIYTQVLLSISEFLQHYALFIIIGFVLVVILIQRYSRTSKGRYNIDRLLLSVPVLKTVITKIAVARFSRTFASLMASGVTVLDSLEVTGRAIGNKVLEKELDEAAKEVKNGKALSEPLSKSKHFPPIVAQMLSVGEESGQIDTVLVKVADFYEEEVETTIDSLASIIEPFMIIILGAIVGLIAASVMGPIANLSKNVSSQ